MRFHVHVGDKRMEYLAQILKSSNFICQNLPQIEVLPIPVTRDGIYITDSKVNLHDFLKNIDQNFLIFCGNKNSIPESQNVKNKIYDYSNNEKFLLQNADLTAQGTIKILSKNSDKPFNKMKILISGFGRIGKNLAKLLLGLESEVYILGHSEKDAFWINKIGANNIEKLKNSDINFDFLVNTVPDEIFCYDNLQKIGNFKNFIELASKPGVNPDICKKLGINHISALGIPGKIFPYYAAEIIKESIFNIINKIYGV